MYIHMCLRFLIFCEGRAAVDNEEWHSPFGFMSRAMAAAAALMSCNEWVAVGDDPAAVMLTGAIRMSCR